jgi:hypothetical protein
MTGRSSTIAVAWNVSVIARAAVFIAEVLDEVVLDEELLGTAGSGRIDSLRDVIAG